MRSAPFSAIAAVSLTLAACAHRSPPPPPPPPPAPPVAAEVAPLAPADASEQPRPVPILAHFRNTLGAWRFDPYLENGRPAPLCTAIMFSYVIETERRP